ncbi:MAG: peptidoglycan binding domain-containing protein [Anaerocolumna sp.]
MKNIKIEKLSKSDVTAKPFIILAASVILIYLLISLYFSNHFFFNTEINGVNVSLKAYDGIDHIFKSFIKDYKLQLIERDNETDELTGQKIGMQYNEKNSLSKIHHIQKSFQWISSLFKGQKYYVKDLCIYNKDNLIKEIGQLHCLNKDMIEPQNVRFKYSKGSYEVINEINGDKIIKNKLSNVIKLSILKGEIKLDLNEKHCYEIPKYTVNSDKTHKTKELLNRYVSTHINYKFGSANEILDGNKINRWLSVDENLDVVLNDKAVKKYVSELSSEYDTVGIARNFKTSLGKAVEVKGGLYGWKINQEDETKALIENIKLGKAIEKEPVYTQKAFSREGNEIGDTYIELNITRQHLWLYEDGKLIVHGSVVTGNPNRGNSTVVGTYTLNYKQKGATLKGAGYEVGVSYWMPFYGNMGIHDASWRYAFGGEIYKRNGTHGCVNAPLYLAKKIFENIEEGIPVISYEE